MRREGRFLFVLVFGLTCGAATTPQTTPTFYKNIAPILYGNCATCHRPGESGPFSLLSYDDAKKHAGQIANVTKSRFMPPWLPEAGHGEFLEERRLTEKQIQTIQDWVKAGAPAGHSGDGPEAPKFSSDWPLGEPDVIVHVTKPYRLAADANETFWNFVMPVPIKESRWVKAMVVRPGNPQVFHHANVIIDRSGSALRKEAAQGSGFEGMDLEIEEDTFDPDGHFLSWKPGAEPVAEPDGMAWRADPGMDLVLNVHMRPSGKEETIDPVIGLYFTDKPQTKFPMLVQLEHDGMIDIPPGDRDYLVSDDFKLPMAVKVLAVYPHAHYLGSLMEAYATLPDGTRKWLVRIPHWDLSWQGVFRLKEPILLPKGAVVSMRFHYDNSAHNVRNPSSPPKEAHGGNRAIDEMSHCWLQVLPVEEGDHRADLQEALMHHRIEKYPGDFSANFNLGDIMMNENNPGAAVPYFRLAVKADPRNAIAAGELGAALFATDNVYEAEQVYQRALELDPKYIDARFNLASIEATNQQWPAAASDFRQILSVNPNHEKAKENLGQVYFLWGEQAAEAGNREQAVQHYRQSLAYRPDDPELHAHLGVVLADLKRYSEAKREFDTVLKLDPNSKEAKDALVAIDARERLGNQ